MNINKNNISEEEYNDVLTYAFQILPQAKDYLQFYLALIEYAGKDILDYCDYIYYEIKASVPSKFYNVIIDPNYGNKYNSHNAQILQEYEKLEAGKNESRQSYFNHNIDELQFLNVKYRSLNQFKGILDFVGKHNFLSPYNALLVYMQKPDSTLVFNGNKWKNDYNRQPKDDAQKLITLIPFGPVQCVFDYSDTEPINNDYPELFVDSALSLWKDILEDKRTKCLDYCFQNLKYNLNVNGIYLDLNLKASDEFPGFTDFYNQKQITIEGATRERVPRFFNYKFNSFLRISVNSNSSISDAFYFICHELVTELCKRDIFEPKLNRKEKLSVKESQFEIETVKWLTFRRLGIYNPNENYLDKYCKEDTVPFCSLEYIMKATTDFEKMLSNYLFPTESFLYKKSKLYKKVVDVALKDAKLLSDERFRY